MRLTTKAGSLLVVTFLLGGVTGLLGGGAWRQRRDRPPPGSDAPPGGGARTGFVEQTLRLIEPSDSVQREALRPMLTQVDGRNRVIVEGARTAMLGELDSLRTRMMPLLTAAQLDRFDDFRRHATGGPDLGGGPPGRGPRPDGAMDDRKGPPPPPQDGERGRPD
ncbi:MAG: hypothetical protein ABI910_23095 [Gemmatimonadota bacterium]